jgi:hypothetical protein
MKKLLIAMVLGGLLIAAEAPEKKEPPKKEGPITLYAPVEAAKIDPNTGEVTLSKGGDVRSLIKQLVIERRKSEIEKEQCLRLLQAKEEKK